MASSNPLNTGAFVPTNLIWDVSQLYQVEVTSPAFKELLVRLYQNINNIALVLNVKDTGIYELQEFVNSQLWFSNPMLTSTSPTNPVQRQVYRKTFLVPGTLPNAGTISFPHNIPITPAVTFTRIYGAASDTTGFNYIPLPYASPTLINNIELNLDGTNVNIITGSNRTNFNITYVVVEYIKS